MQESSQLFFQMRRQGGEGRVCVCPVYYYARTLKYKLEFGVLTGRAGGPGRGNSIYRGMTV